MLSLFIGFFREEVKNFRTLQKPLCSFGHCFYTLHVTTGTVQGLLQVTKIMYLLTEWEGRTGKYLAQGHGVRTERSEVRACLLYTSPSPRDLSTSRMPSSA